MWPYSVVSASGGEGEGRTGIRKERTKGVQERHERRKIKKAKEKESSGDRESLKEGKITEGKWKGRCDREEQTTKRG